MSIFSRYFARRRKIRQEQADAEIGISHLLNFAWGSRSNAAYLANPEQALQIAAVWRCISIVAGVMGSIPFSVFERGERGDKPARTHPLNWLIGTQPNPEMTSIAYRSTTLLHALLWGNHYGEIVRDAVGRAVAVYPLHPDRVKPMRDQDYNIVYQVLQSEGDHVYLPARNTLHVVGMSFSGLRGYDVVEFARQQLRTALVIDKWTGNYFLDGMNPPGVITTPRDHTLTPSAIANLIKSFRKSMGSGAHKPFIAEPGMDYKAISHTPEQAQFLDTRLFMVREICRIFGVPPYMVFASDHKLRANVEQQNREFMWQTLIPLGTRIEQEVDRKLLLFPRLYRTKHDFRKYTQGDLKSRMAYYKAMRDIGVFTINDVRYLEDLEDIGPKGDHCTMQMQYRVIGDDGNPGELPAGSGTGAADEDSEADDPDEDETMPPDEDEDETMPPEEEEE